MDPNRKLWNQGEQKLRQALAAHERTEAIKLFLIQHAMLHSAKVSKAGLWSFEDEVLNDLPEEQFRCVPPRSEHSIAWIIFHLARIEDITMNLLIAGTPQLFLRDDWKSKLNVRILHAGNEMDDISIASLSVEIDLNALRAYRQSVGRRTREIVRKLKAEDFGEKASPARLERIMEERALLPEAAGIRDYWSKRTIAGLLLMPPTRHNFLHLNEALRIKQKLQRAK